LEDVASFIGGMMILFCSTIGAFIILRWGLMGVKTLWQFRGELDAIVRKDVERTVLG
jgi:predicted ABC-type sugar transport system permease subunit